MLVKIDILIEKILSPSNGFQIQMLDFYALDNK